MAASSGVVGRGAERSDGSWTARVLSRAVVRPLCRSIARPRSEPFRSQDPAADGDRSGCWHTAAVVLAALSRAVW